MQVRPDVHTYDLDGWGYGEPLSVHVVDTGEATILFGGGDESMGDDIVSVAHKHGVDIVVVEHGDGDHYGGVPALTAALDVTVAVPAGDADALVEADIDPDHRLAGSERYWGFSTISAPGHTSDNMAYLYGDVLVAGDTVVGADSAFAAPDEVDGALSVITPDFSDDDDQARASVRRLLDHEFEVVLVSHGSNVLADGRAEVERLVAALSA